MRDDNGYARDRIINLSRHVSRIGFRLTRITFLA